MNKTQAIVLGGIVAIAAINQAHAQTVPASASPSTATFTTTSGNFIQNAFTFTLSKNVALASNDNTSAVAVSTASTKGSQQFGGSTNGSSGVQSCLSTTTTSPTPSAATATGNGCS